MGFDPLQPFTRAEALAAGITPWQLRGREFVRLHRNVYVARRAPRTLVLRAKAALRVAPRGTIVSHHSAALLWGGSGHHLPSFTCVSRLAKRCEWMACERMKAAPIPLCDGGAPFR